MAAVEARTRLLEYLDQRVFQPILARDPDSVAEGFRTPFEELQDLARRTWERLRSCRSAEALFEQFDRFWHSDEAIEARRGLARLGISITPGAWRDLTAMAHKLGVKRAVPALPELNPEIERRIRERAHALWEEDGRPGGGKEDYLERARELEAIADNPDAALLPNPMTQGTEPRPDIEQPAEPLEAVENQAEFPDPLMDQGERIPAPISKNSG